MTTSAATIKRSEIAKHVADVMDLKGRDRTAVMKSVRSALESNGITDGEHPLDEIERWLATYKWPVRGRGSNRSTSAVGKLIKEAFAKRLPSQSVSTGFLAPGPMLLRTDGLDRAFALSDPKTLQEVTRLHSRLQEAEHTAQVERGKRERALRLLRDTRTYYRKTIAQLETDLSNERNRNNVLHEELKKHSKK